MGLFLDMTGVAGASATDVADALASYAKSKGKAVSPAPTADPKLGKDLLIREGTQNRVAVLYSSACYDSLVWEAHAALSWSLKKPAFSFHIHDGDFWMYELYANGRRVDGFMPIPDYFSAELADEEREKWAGSPWAICNYWPDLREEDVQGYLKEWRFCRRNKSYPTDEFTAGDEWQLLDFMKRLGLCYPEPTDPLTKHYVVS